MNDVYVEPTAYISEGMRKILEKGTDESEKLKKMAEMAEKKSKEEESDKNE